MAHTFEDLVELEHAAVQAQAQLQIVDDYDTARQVWRKAAAKFQTAVTEHAAAEGKPRVEVEMAVKQAVRHAEG